MVSNIDLAVEITNFSCPPNALAAYLIAFIEQRNAFRFRTCLWAGTDRPVGRVGMEKVPDSLSFVQ